MRRDIATLLLASALYGFSIGCVHSTRFGLHNIIKFPLLFLMTGAACAAAYFLWALLIGGARFGFVDVQRLAMRLYRDAALLLAALAPANWFLARTLVPPDATSLHEYPMFLGLNVFFIAAAGALALAAAGARARALPPLAAVTPGDHGRRLAGAVAAGRRPGRLDAAPILRRPQHPRRRDALLPRLVARLPRRDQLLRGRLQRRRARRRSPPTTPGTAA